MGRFPIKISLPDGSLPAFGDHSQTTGSRSYRNHAAAVARLTRDEDEILWYATEGKEGRKPAYDSVALDWAGYYVMRTGWEKDDLYMAIKAGPFGAAHQNEDKLSFELAAYGERFLVDPGMYIYDSANPWRKYFVSSLAHNTVVVDGLTQYRRDERDQWVATEPNDAIWISEPDYDYFSGYYNSGYTDFTRYPFGIESAEAAGHPSAGCVVCQTGCLARHRLAHPCRSQRTHLRSFVPESAADRRNRSRLRRGQRGGFDQCDVGHLSGRNGTRKECGQRANGADPAQVDLFG